MDNLAILKDRINKFLTHSKKEQFHCDTPEKMQAEEDRRLDFENDLNNIIKRNFKIDLSMIIDFISGHQPVHLSECRNFASAMDVVGFLCMWRDDHMTLAERSLTAAYRCRADLWSREPHECYSAYLYGVALWHMAKLQRAWGDAEDDAGYAGQDIIDASYDAEIPWAQKARQHLATVNATWPDMPLIVDTLRSIERRLVEIELSSEDRSR